MARRPSLLLVLAVIAGAAACKTDPKYQYFKYPVGVLSSTSVDFGATDQGASVARTITFTNQGELNMGISGITLGTTDHSSDFTASWTRSEVTCPDAPADTGTAEAKGFTMDSGTGGETGIEDTGGGGDEGIELVLEPGCTVPIHLSFTASQLGVVWGSLVVETATEELPESAGANAEPGFWMDPKKARHMVYLKGEGERGIPNVLVSPRRYDFGHLWEGLTDKGFVTIRNLGDGTLTINNIYLSSSDCDAAFTISNAEEGFDTSLEPDQATFVEITFSPSDNDAAYCDLVVESDDEDSPSIEVPLQGNAGLDPNNQAPSVIIRDPDVGYQHASRNPFDMELNVFDVNQPATSLTCRVKSMVLAEAASIAECDPPDSSGHLFVSIDPTLTGDGIDTLRVQVTDGAEIISYDSISVLFNTAYPDSDDDGDGWGDIGDVDEFGNYDCDDSNIDTYPYAAEIPDGEDNDCDKIADEGTVYYDDDGDSFTEAAGDCNDIDPAIYPGAYEENDSKDNDCDGTIDEGTSVYDDDGDGYTEMDMDCDDADPDVNPGSVEYCDGIDNNCNGLRDYADGCIELTSVPYIVGGINMYQTACESGDRISLSVFVYDADGQNLDYAWTGDEGVVIDPITGSPTVTVTCPELPEDSDGQAFSLYVVATDTDGNAVWDFQDLWVYPKDGLYTPYTKIVSTGSTGCGGASTRPGSATAGLALAGLAVSIALLARRRA